MKNNEFRYGRNGPARANGVIRMARYAIWGLWRIGLCSVAVPTPTGWGWGYFCILT